jgi:hypothetical protein
MQVCLSRQVRDPRVEIVELNITGQPNITISLTQKAFQHGVGSMSNDSPKTRVYGTSFGLSVFGASPQTKLMAKSINDG